MKSVLRKNFKKLTFQPQFYEVVCVVLIVQLSFHVTCNVVKNACSHEIWYRIHGPVGTVLQEITGEVCRRCNG